jgi:4-hydroxy-tetrahydrodipicolinate synthase
VTQAPDRLRGSIVPVVTPFVDGRIDIEAFEASIDRQANEGSNGVVITGTTGEPTSLSLEERADLFARAVRVGAGRLVVAAATGSANTADTVQLTAAAEAAGVDAVLIVSPAFVKPSQRGLVEHFSHVGTRTELPFLIYNIPGRAGVGVTAATVERVAERAPNVVGLKHASPQLDLITELLASLGEDFRLFCGLESYSYPFLALGGCGLMSAIGNVFPGRVQELCDAVEAGDHETALRIHRDLFAVNQAVFFDTNPGPLKAMLAERGLGSAEVRLPLVEPDHDVRERVLAALATTADLGTRR